MFPREFSFIVILYIWRAVSLLANNLSIVPIKEIFDKFVYVIFSNVKLNVRVINGVLISIFLSNFAILSFGIYDYFFPTFWNKYYEIYTKHFNLTIKKLQRIGIKNGSNKPVEVKINEDKILIPAYSTLFFKLDRGNYIISSNENLVIYAKEKISENLKYFKNFWNETNNFMGPLGHKLVAATIFSILTVLFFCAFLYLNKLYLFAFLTSLISLILTFSKSYIPITILILILILLTKRKNIALIVSTFVVFAILSVILLKFRPEFYNAFNLRNNFYKAGIEIFQKNPIFGIGYNHVSDYLEEYVRKGIIDNYAHTHNIYTDTLAETGIVGFILFIITYIYFAVYFLNSGYRSNNFLSIASFWIIVLIMMSGFFEKNLDRATLDLLIFSIMGISRASLNERTI